MNVQFSAEQHVALLQWLEGHAEAGLTLQEVIEGLKDGSLTTPAYDQRIKSFPVSYE